MRTVKNVEIVALLLAENQVGVGVSWLRFDEALFYGMCFAMSFASAFFTLLYSPDIKSLGERIAAGFVSGFLGLSIICLWVGRIDQPLSHHWHWLGLAIIIGLNAKRGEMIREKALAVAFGAFSAAFQAATQAAKKQQDRDPNRE